MIQNPFALTVLLFVLVAGIAWLEKVPAFGKLYHYLPSAFWCYFVPMLLATFGILPDHSKVYDFLTTYVLASCLLLLLLNINLPAIFKLGPTALGAMAVGAIGIAIGAVAAYAIFSRWLPPDTWKGVGALSGSWIGGSANMLAVKEALQTSESVFAPMVIVDTVITYSWMGLMVALSSKQEAWDRWVKADRGTIDDVVQRLQNRSEFRVSSHSFETKGGDSPLLGTSSESQPETRNPKRETPSIWHALWLMGGGMAIGWLCLKGGALLPKTQTLSASGWAFLIITAVGIMLSLTPAARLERYGASRWGYFCLYLLLAAMGSKARLQSILQAPLLIVMAYTWVFIHAAILGIYGYIRRVPMFFLVTSSQANIGGTASTPIVAGVYQPQLASLGLLLAISGNVIGTYAGILIAQACHFIHP